VSAQILLSDEQQAQVKEELASHGLVSAVVLIRQLSSADLASAVAYGRQLQGTSGIPNDGGTLAAFSRPRNSLVYWTDLFISRENARAALGRAPDFEDTRVVSWGRISLDEAERLLRLCTDPEFQAEILADLRELSGAVGSTIVTLYFADPYRVY
jgi:hypothetical protein